MDTSEYLPMFLAESREHLQELNLAVVRIEEAPEHRETVDEIFRIAHSLKGMSATMGFAAIAALTHEMENVFELLRQRTDGLSRDAIDVLFECLDALEVAVGAIESDGTEQLDPATLIERLQGLVRDRTPEQELELIGGVDLPDLTEVPTDDGRRVVHVIAELGEEALMPAVRAFMLFSALAEHGEIVGSIPTQEGVEQFAGEAAVPGLQQAIQDLARSSQALQAMVMQVRMIPVEAVFLRFPRLVRDLSSKLRKEVELQLVGQDTELDRTVVDALGDPLVHLVRNSLDHGLEPPEERAAKGKTSTGVLEISARHAGGNVVISVRDDGRGIDPARVARKAVERGLIPAEAEATVDVTRAIELLFAPGFSTAEETSDISGRGVGMDAVQASIRDLGGEVVMESVPGEGSRTEIRLPLTLAIMAALLVETQGLPFAIPLDRVERTLRLEDHTVRSVAGARMLVLGDGVLPLIDAGQTLGRGCGAAGEKHAHAVIVRGRERRLALAVATLVGQRELVTRPLPPEVSDSAAVSGGAVLSNGEIALIVDCDALTAVRADPVPVA
jgi:chemotaxis protein histidine kinase CheA